LGKRSNFERREKDFYPTPKEAVLPLLPHLMFKTYYEPCVGEGDLINHLPIKCIGQSDLETNACYTQYSTDAECFITNPPWDRKVLHPIIENLRNQLPTWLLFDADWMHTKQSKDLMQYCHMIVSVGRIKWVPDSKMTGKDNCCWYLFKKEKGVTVFYGR
jgi:hypothetical protein